MRLAQLSDPHIGAEWTAVDPLDTLAAVLTAIRVLPDPVDALLVTGDLAADGADEQYAAVGDALDAAGLAYHVLAGNHDARDGLRRRFPLSGFGEEPIQYEVALDGLRVLMLDTTIPGQGPGALDDGRLEWLAAEDRAAVAELVAEHPQVCGIVAGHVHRTMIAAVGGRPVVTVPSTYCQFPLDATAEHLTPTPDPIGFAVHTLVDGRLVSHVQTLPVTA